MESNHGCYKDLKVLIITYLVIHFHRFGADSFD